jgi:hypothetical protein
VHIGLGTPAARRSPSTCSAWSWTSCGRHRPADQIAGGAVASASRTCSADIDQRCYLNVYDTRDNPVLNAQAGSVGGPARRDSLSYREPALSVWM